jgi:acyl-coenzyme A synthetase/AMP-(fatty) acid ligase
MKNSISNISIKNINKCHSISEILKLNSIKFPKKVFIYDHTSEKIIKISYLDFNYYVNCCCNFFNDLKIKKGEVISILLNNSLAYLIIYFASIRYGSILNPLPTTLGNKIISEKILEVNPRIIFKDKNVELNDKKFKKKIIEINNYQNFILQLINTKTKKKKLRKENKKSIVMLYYSSGTTGKSKLISYSNEAILENQKSLVSSRLTYNRNIHLCFLPLYHTASLRYSIKFNLCVGGTVVLFKNFWSLKDSIWKIVDKYKINYFQTVPTILNVILNTKYTKFSRPKSIKFVGSSSAILPWQMKKNFEKKFKIKISNLYGLSEIGCSHFQDPFVKNEKPGFIGKILPAFKFKIFKENNLSKNIDVGELGIKSKALLSNYYNNNKLYKKSFKKNFFLTGDYVSIDSKKNFFYIDRKKDLIIKGGVNILPSEIETVLQKLKEVKDVAVTSIFDEFYGENICCYLVFHKNVKIDLKKIDSYCLMQLGSFKKPDNYHILEDLPKGPSGKVLKIELKKINEK